MVLLIVRALLQRPSLSGSPTVTFCSVHFHSVGAQKRDASTELLQRLYGYMREHNVHFIGGDYNMSAFSTVGDVRRILSAWQFIPVRLVHWRSRLVKALGFSSCQSVLTSGVSIHMAATSLTMLRLAWDFETKLLIFLFFFISVLPICLDPAASCVVSKRNKEDLSADTINMKLCGDDVRDRAPVCQGHVSVSPFTPLAVARAFRQSVVSSLCFDARTFCFKSLSLSLSLCLCVFVSLCLCVFVVFMFCCRLCLFVITAAWEKADSWLILLVLCAKGHE